MYHVEVDLEYSTILLINRLPDNSPKIDHPNHKISVLGKSQIQSVCRNYTYYIYRSILLTHKLLKNTSEKKR